MEDLEGDSGFIVVPFHTEVKMMRRSLVSLGAIIGYVLLNLSLSDNVPFWVNVAAGLPLIVVGLWWARRKPRRNYFYEPFNRR